MLAINPRTTWTWPQQSPSPANNSRSTKRKKDTRRSGTSDTKFSFSDHRASTRKTTEGETIPFITGVVGRQILPSAGSIFHDQSSCQHNTEDAEPASKVSRVAVKSEEKMNLNCIKSCDTAILSLNDNNNYVSKSIKPTNTNEKRKMWLKRKKKKSLLLQNDSESKKGTKLPPVFLENSNGKNYSVSNNVDSIETIERNNYNIFWNNSRTANPFVKTSENSTEQEHIIQSAQYTSHKVIHSNGHENEESAKNRLLDILLSDKESEVDRENIESKHESAIKEHLNKSTLKRSGRLHFVKKLTQLSTHSRPSFSSQINDSNSKAVPQNRLSDVNNSITYPTIAITKDGNHFNSITPKLENGKPCSNHKDKTDATIVDENSTFFKRGSSALSSIRQTLKRKFVPSNHVNDISALDMSSNINEQYPSLIVTKESLNCSKDQSIGNDTEPMEVDVSVLSNNLVSRLNISDEDKPSAKIPHHLAGVGSCDTSQDSGLGEDSDHNSSYNMGNLSTITSPRKPTTLNLQNEASGHSSRLGDPNNSFSSQYPTPILRPPTLSFRDSTCSSNLSSFCSSSKKHVVIQEPNMNKVHQFSYGSKMNHEHEYSDYVKEEERSLRYDELETPIHLEIATYRDAQSYPSNFEQNKSPIKYSVTNQWKRIYQDAEEEVIQRLEQKFCHVRPPPGFKANTINCDKALKSSSCGNGFHRYVGLIFIDSSPPSSAPVRRSSPPSSASVRRSFVEEGHKDLNSLSSNEISQLVDVVYQILFYDGWLFSPRDTIIVHCVQRFLVVVIDVCCQELDIDVRLRLAKDFRFLLKQSEQEHYKDLKQILKQTQILYIQLWCSLLCVPFQPKKNCYNNTGQISGQLFPDKRIKGIL